MGKHTLRFGFDVRRELYNALLYYAPSDDYGNFAFNGTFTNYSIGDMLLGLPTTSYFAITSPQPMPTPGSGASTARISGRCAAALRSISGCDGNCFPRLSKRRATWPVFCPRPIASWFRICCSKPSPIARSINRLQCGARILQCVHLPNRNTSIACSNVQTASQAGLPQGLRHTPMRDFDPRVSVAWRPFNDNNTVVRAGLGPLPRRTLGPMSFNNAGVGLSDLLTFNNSVTSTGTTFQFQTLLFLCPVGRRLF